MNDKNYAHMFSALKRIKSYQSPAQIKKKSWSDWGCQDGNEALEMAYENVLQEARDGLKGVRKPKPALTTPKRTD